MRNEARAGRPLQGSSSVSQICSSDNHSRAISDLPGLFECWDFFLLNPDCLAVTPNLDHNLKLAELWGFHIYSKLNPPLYIGETFFFPVLSQHKLRLPVAAKLVSILKLLLAGEVESSSRQEGPGSCCLYQNHREFFKNKCFSKCPVALTDFQCDGIIVLVMFSNAVFLFCEEETLGLFISQQQEVLSLHIGFGKIK